MPNPSCAGRRDRSPRRGHAVAATLLALASLLGCGEHRELLVDSGADVGLADGGTRDAGTDSDGGPVVDGDSDGIPRDLDCDDTNGAVGRSATRECTTSCEAGSETCVDAEWSACSASTECTCGSEGLTRTVTCGRCGSGTQTCGDDLRWSPVAECRDEGECLAGAVEVDDSRCGERRRVCNVSCTWGEWEVITPRGECDPGATSESSTDCTPGMTRLDTCSESCEWTPGETCEFRCTRAPQSSQTGADPVCIPRGSFILGTHLPRTVNLSEFYIDRYPVTKARYEMCVAAGACPVPDAETYATFPADARAAYLPRDADLAFCLWDGGQLVTEYQWEKAARGPAPNEIRHSWVWNPSDLCEVHPAPACPDQAFPITSTTFPGAVSPYGVRMLGSLFEHTSTPWTADHSWIAPGATDPAPTGAGTRATRGYGWEMFTVDASATVRWEGRIARAGFRCAY